MKKKIALALIYLPLLFVAWYYCSPLIALVVSLVIKPAAGLFTAGQISAVGYASAIVYGTVQVAAGTYGELVVPAGQMAEMRIEARPMVYGYSIPLFFTLLFAFAPRTLSDGKKILALLILLLGVCAGTLMEMVKNVYFNLDPAMLVNGPPGPFAMNVLAVSYQLTTLILPAVLPVVLWFAFSGRTLFEQYFPAPAATGQMSNDEH